LRKSVGFSIKYFKYVNGRFAFPFSHSEAFRILVYDQEEHLILDSTVQAEDVAVSELMNEEAAPPASILQILPRVPNKSAYPPFNHKEHKGHKVV